MAEGADINEADDDGLTPLILAAYAGQIGTIEWLLEHGADPNIQNDDRETCLISGMAPKNADEVIPILLKAGANPNLRDTMNRTPLIWAAVLGHTGAAQALIAAGTDLSIRDEGNASALTGAVISGHLEVVDALLAAGDKTDLGQAAMIAMNDGKTELLLKLVDGGLSPDYAEGDRNMSLLHYAAALGNAKATQELLKRGAKPDPVDILLTAPLGLAASGGHVDVLKALLAGGAEVDHVTKFQGSALRAAAESGCLACVEVLLEAGADPGLRDQWDKSSVYYAEENGHPELVEVLKQAAAGAKR